MNIFQSNSANNIDVPLFKDGFRRRILDWVLKMQTSPNQFKMNADTDSTIFTSCFALFILDLLKETENFTEEQRAGWISYIQSRQNKLYGYFEPEEYYHEDKERNRYQLTCFCLSALQILNARPEFSLSFVSQWKTPDDIKEYLYKNGCHAGKGCSGNKAMFLAIFLTYEYERTKENHLLDKINAWFDFHNETQNSDGFWGGNKGSHSLPGLQNGLHQFIIYSYWKRELSKLNKIIDIALTSQDKQGFFAPTPGGWACYDYDAIHILAMAHKITNYRKDEIETCLRKALDALLNTYNSNGGFCHSKYRLTNCIDFIRCIPLCFSGKSPYLWYYRLRSSLGVLLKQQVLIHEGWTKIGRKREESSLWDTWFRCLAIAEIDKTLNINLFLNKIPWKFHNTIGLGYFNCDD